MHPRPTPKPSALSVLNLKCLAISLEGHLYAPILSDRRWARRRAGGRWRAEHNCGGLKRLGVADGDAENAAIGGLEDHGDAVAVPADRRLNLASVTGELRDFVDPAHDIDMRQGPPAFSPRFTALTCRRSKPISRTEAVTPAPPGPTLICAWP